MSVILKRSMFYAVKTRRRFLVYDFSSLSSGCFAQIQLYVRYCNRKQSEMQFEIRVEVLNNDYLRWFFVDKTGIYLYYIVLRTNNIVNY